MESAHTLARSRVTGFRDKLPVCHALYDAYPIIPYNIVHTGPKTHGGGRKGGCLSCIYLFCVSFAVSINTKSCLVLTDLRLMAYPMPAPTVTGKRIAAAGVANTAEGSVKAGMKAVIVRLTHHAMSAIFS